MSMSMYHKALFYDSLVEDASSIGPQNYKHRCLEAIFLLCLSAPQYRTLSMLASLQDLSFDFNSPS